MTNENIIEIKKQQKGWFAKGLLFLALMLASLYVSLMPLVSDFANKNSNIFYVAGFSLFIIFTFAFVFNIYKTCKPANALVLSAHGFIDNINIGEGIEIEWTNVTAVKMLGKTNMPYLGVTLENTDFIISRMKKKAAAEMLENINQNLPTILIAQSSVKAPIKELKETFTKFVREARLLEKNTQQKAKVNPFSTDDVLRAFGKLPKDESDTEPTGISSDDNDSEVATSADANATKEFGEDSDKTTATREFTPSENITRSTPSPFEIPSDIVTDTAKKDSENKSASDSFYEALRSKANAKSISQSNDTALTVESAQAPSAKVHSDTDGSEEEMPEELQEILGRARSSKITEIEELLSANDIPYSLSREKTAAENSVSAENEVFEEKVLADETAVDEVKEDTDNISIDITFEDETQHENTDKISPPSLTDLFNEGDEGNYDSTDLDVNFAFARDENNEPAEDVSVSSLANMIEEALKTADSNVNTSGDVANSNSEIPDDSADGDDFGDTKEFIFKP